MSAPEMKIVPLPDGLQLLMLYAGALAYFERKLFFFIILYIVSFFLLM
jgi:hypothetical protein